MGHDEQSVRSARQGVYRAFYNIKERVGARFSQVWRDRRGVTSFEFALTFPIIMVLILGAMEMYRIMYFETQMQGAVADVSRYGYVGKATQDAANKVACPSAYSNLAVPSTFTALYEITCRLEKDLCPGGIGPDQCPIDVTQLSINVASFNSLAALGTNQQNFTTPSTAGTPGPGVVNDIAVYEFKYQLPLATGVLTHQNGLRIFGGPGQSEKIGNFTFPTFPIAGFAVVYNEPFT